MQPQTMKTKTSRGQYKGHGPQIPMTIENFRQFERLADAERRAGRCWSGLRSSGAESKIVGSGRTSLVNYVGAAVMQVKRKDGCLPPSVPHQQGSSLPSARDNRRTVSFSGPRAGSEGIGAPCPAEAAIPQSCSECWLMTLVASVRVVYLIDTTPIFFFPSAN